MFCNNKKNKTEWMMKWIEIHFIHEKMKMMRTEWDEKWSDEQSNEEDQQEEEKKKI